MVSKKGGILMALIHIGSVIKRIRLQKGMTQEELARSILEVQSLYAIERGDRMPSIKIRELLFEKLGYYDDNFYDNYLDNKLIRVQEILYELEGLLEYPTPTKSDPIIERVDALVKELESTEKYIKFPQNKQHILLFKVANAMNKKLAPDLIQGMLSEALKINIADYKAKDIPRYYLTMQDRKLLALLATTYSDENRHKDAADIMFGLKQNLDNHCIDKAELGRYYPWVTYTLAKYLLEDCRYEEVIENCDAGLKACKDTRSMYHYPHIAYMKATALGWLGRVEESEGLYLQVINALELFEMHDDIDGVRRMMKTVLGKEL